MDCPRGHLPFGRYRVGTDGRCLTHAALSRPFLRTAIPTCLVVGTILCAINQGNVVAHGGFPAALWWKVPLTYSVPFLVSTWSQLRALRIRPLAT